MLLRRSAAVLLAALGGIAALAAAGASASRGPVPVVLGVDTTPFTATVSWRLPEAARVVVEVGRDERYGIWSPTTVARAAGTGTTALTGLEPATVYRFRVVARWGSGLRSEARGSFRTDPWPHATSAAAPRSAPAGTAALGAGSPYVLPPARPPGVAQPPSSSQPQTSSGPRYESSAPLLVNGHPVFPRMVWRQCPAYYGTSLGAGINLFLGAWCDTTPEMQMALLAGRALSTVDAHTPGVTGPGMIGWHLPDEADVSVGGADRLPSPKADGRVTFLTLTDKFATGTAPGPHGKEIYPGLFALADVIGFDTYPIEVRCSLAQIDNVYWMQRELVQLAQGKPTFQWIEAGPMEHCRDNEDPTPATVRAQVWLAIAGGATGIGYFPDYWAEDIRNEVRRINRDLVSLAPALLSPPARVSAPDGPVRVAARRYNGALYVIVVNTSTTPARATFSAAGLQGRTLRTFAEGREVRPLGDVVTDTLPGLGVAIYVAPPAGW
ncbi:MAG: fibronectin type III domain-containing protein [Thermoleophilia bacterium]|nr:fibronectin type III domain-containing protein [Gaiellaceae bacterium]MDW8338229.1 fibronectin type III domain-containing protein [Thermoleophilia bacterium]